MSVSTLAPVFGSRVLDTQALYEIVSGCIATHEERLADICAKACGTIHGSTMPSIHDNPELNYEEYQAHDNICNLMEGLGYAVTRHAYGLETSFEVEYGQGGRLIVFNAEYDALPGLGHSCGHNLIATSSIAAFLATVEALRDSGVAGRVRLLGTPAEENGGGKVRLIRAGAYTGVDACLMAHPMGYMPPLDKVQYEGVSAPRTVALKRVNVSYTGKNAHGGFAPWEGKNALDAVVASYMNVSLLRQQMPPTARVNGIIRQGGAQANIIPDSTSMEYYIREANAQKLQDLSTRVECCFRAGAAAAGCGVDCEWLPDLNYMDLVSNIVIARAFTRHMEAFGRKYLEQDSEIMGASTDMGNVSYETPSFHCSFSVGLNDPLIQPHTPQFAAAAGTRTALERTLDCAKGMAATAYDLLVSAGMSSQAWEEFKERFSPSPKP